MRGTTESEESEMDAPVQGGRGNPMRRFDGKQFRLLLSARQDNEREMTKLGKAMQEMKSNGEQIRSVESSDGKVLLYVRVH